ncbi:BRCT domain-containing protein [Shewanella baltica]|uniref:BRCT domain-containing protein n=1 Tax=Shewanella baltica TaxID=62322 RepID=UPI0039AFA284
MRIIEICFTGFDTDERKKLWDLAESHGFLVRKEVTKKLHVLCTGKNAGPKKLEDAIKDGVIIITGDDFITYTKTGIPETIKDAIEQLRLSRKI